MVECRPYAVLAFFILETSVEREKDVQVIEMLKEARKCEVTLLAMNTFMASLSILRSCADFRVATEDSRILGQTQF